MSEDIVYPLSANIIGTSPVTINGNSFAWNEELSQWELIIS